MPLNIALPPSTAVLYEVVSAKQFAKGCRKDQYAYAGIVEHSGELHFTHRHAFGTSGGDEVINSDLSASTIADLKRLYPDVFSEPVFPVHRSG